MRQKCCSPCGIPRVDLTLEWSGPAGSGTVNLVYSNGQWASAACDNQLLYFLSCVGGNTRFAVRYFVSGGCPGGQALECASTDDPASLTLADYTCHPFHLHYQLTEDSCNALYANGITDFTIDGPADETVLGCDECAVICSSCRGTRFDREDGTITDTNGTHKFEWVDSIGGWRSDIVSVAVNNAINTSAGDVPLTCNHNIVSRNVSYYYVMFCDFGVIGQLMVDLVTPKVIPSTPPNRQLGYLVQYDVNGFVPPPGHECGNDMPINFTSPYFSTENRSYIVPANINCSNGMTTTATFQNYTWPSDPPLTLSPIVATATVNIPKVKGRGQVCCSPCPIPKKDLTFSWIDGGGGTTPGSSPMRYMLPGTGFPAGTDFWATDVFYIDNPFTSTGYWRVWIWCSDGTYTIRAVQSLVDINIQFDIFGRGFSVTSFTCDPFHYALSTGSGFIGFIDE